MSGPAPKSTGDWSARLHRPDRLTLFFAVNYLAQGLGGIAYEPLSYWLKDGLKLSAAESAGFTAVMTLPFLAKPFFGLLSDAGPCAGARRKLCFLAAASLSSLSWIFLAGAGGASYGLLLAPLFLANIGLCVSDVVGDAVMVENGTKEHKTGFYQAAQIGALYAGLVASGLGAGWLSAHAPARLIFAMTAVFPAVAAAAAFFWMPAENGLSRRPIEGRLAGLAVDKRFWAVALLIFLWGFSPFLGTAQFYYQSEALGLSPVFIGGLGTAAGLAGMAGAGTYGKTIERRLGIESLLKGAVVIGAASSLLYVFYRGPVSVLLLTVLLSGTSVFFRLSLMDLAARSCPADLQATVFAVYMAVFNFAAWSSNAAGGFLYDFFREALGFLPNPAYGSMVALALLGGGFTLSGWRILPHCLKAAKSHS